MAISNYWLLLGWIFIAGIIFLFVPKREELQLNGHRELRWRGSSAFFLFLPYIVWSGWRTKSWGDTATYRGLFDAAPTGLSNIRDYIADVTRDKGYYAIQVLFKTYIADNATAFFVLIALIQGICLVYTYRRYSRNYWLSFFFFVASGDYLSWMHNGIRQFLVVSILFAALPLIVKRKYIWIILLIIVLYPLHASVLLFIPFIFIAQGRPWNWRTLLFLLIAAVSLFYVNDFTGFITRLMEESVYENEVEYFIQDTGTSLIRVLFYSVPALMSFVFRKHIEESKDPVINICVNFSIITAGLYLISSITSGVFVGRLPIYFSLTNYILIPWIITQVFEKSSALFLEIIFIITYIIFFYYQVGITWQLL